MKISIMLYLPWHYTSLLISNSAIFSETAVSWCMPYISHTYLVYTWQSHVSCCIWIQYLNTRKGIKYFYRHCLLHHFTASIFALNRKRQEEKYIISINLEWFQFKNNKSAGDQRLSYVCSACHTIKWHFRSMKNTC